MAAVLTNRTAANVSGTDTEAHFDDDAPANVAMAAYRAETGGFSYNSGNR